MKCKLLVLQSKITRRLDKGSVKTEAEIAAEVLLTPKLIFKLPSLPKLVRIPLRKLKSFWKKVVNKFRKYHNITLLCLLS